MVKLTQDCGHTGFIFEAFVVFQVRRVKSCQLFQICRSQQGKNIGPKGEVVPVVQPLVPHVDGSEVIYVVTSSWLNVVEGGCY